jgi:hypothetical protein
LAENRYPAINDGIHSKTALNTNAKPTANTKSDMDLLEKTRKAVLKAVEIDETFLPLDYLIQITRSRGHDINPASAIVGGFLGQEILKVLAQKVLQMY